MIAIIIILIIIILFIGINKLLKKYNKNHNSSEKFENFKASAIIIEPREHKALEFVLDNFMSNLPNNWNFIIFHGNKNINYINNIINNKLQKYKNRITLKNLNINNLTLKDYNKLLTSETFYNEIPTEIFLIFQTDSIICEEYKNLINNFLQYDYTGAPWRDKNIGNGGLSLRRKSKMLEIIKKCSYKNEPEDVYFSLSCPNIHRNKPTFEEAKKFSVEMVYNNASFGVHKPWLHLNKSKIINKNKFCKNLHKLHQLNI